MKVDEKKHEALGNVLVSEFLEPYGISQAQLAGDVDIPISRVRGIINGTQGISIDTAIRFAAYFNTTINFWLNPQNDR